MIYRTTSLQTWLMCGRKYKYKYVDEVDPAFHFWPAVKGTIFHRCVAELSSPSLNLFEGIFYDVIEEMEETAVIMGKDTLENSKEELFLIFEQYFKWMKEQNVQIPLHPHNREVKLEGRLGGSKISGTLDAFAVHADTPDGMVEIHDYKTGKKWHNDALNRNLQAGLYTLLAKQNGYKVNRFFWCKTSDLIPYKADGKHGRKGDNRGPFLYPIHISEEDLTFVLNMAMECIGGIERNIFPWNGAVRMDGGDALCSLCEYKGHCPSFEIGVDTDKMLEQQLGDSIEKESQDGSEGDVL